MKLLSINCKREHEHFTKKIYYQFLAHDLETRSRVNNNLVLPRFPRSKCPFILRYKYLGNMTQSYISQSAFSCLADSPAHCGAPAPSAGDPRRDSTGPRGWPHPQDLSPPGAWWPWTAGRWSVQLRSGDKLKTHPWYDSPSKWSLSELNQKQPCKNI